MRQAEDDFIVAQILCSFLNLLVGLVFYKSSQQGGIFYEWIIRLWVLEHCSQ